jgi:2,3-dihydroxybenzoate decarboxylase
MSFPRHREIFPSDGGASLAASAPAHRLDEFPAGYSSAGCSPAWPAFASPAGHQYALMSSCRSRTFHRTANCVLTVCVSRGGKRTYFLWRFDSRFKIFNFGRTLQKQPSSYIRENVSITTAGLFSTPPLRCALEELGEDRVLFSIDYPYESSKAAGDWLDNAGLAADTLRKVASGNAKRLLRLQLSS